MYSSFLIGVHNTWPNTPPRQKTGGSGHSYRATDNRALEGEEERMRRRGPSGPLDHYQGDDVGPRRRIHLWRVSSVLSDFTLEGDDCNPISEVINLTPVVIICDSSRSCSNKRIIRQLLSVRIESSLNLILSIFRKSRNSMTLIEILYTQFGDKILSSQENTEFAFQVRMFDNITFSHDEIMARSRRKVSFENRHLLQ